MAQNSLPFAGSGSNSSGYGLRDAHLTYATDSRDQGALGNPGFQDPGLKAAVNSAGSVASQAWPPNKQAGTPQALQVTDTAYPQPRQMEGFGWQIKPPPSSGSTGAGNLPAGQATSWGAAVTGCTPAGQSSVAPGMQQQQYAQHVPYNMQQQQYRPQQQQQVPWGSQPMQPGWDQKAGTVPGPIQLAQHSSSTAMHGRTQGPVLQGPQHMPAASTRPAAAQQWQRVPAAPDAAAMAAAAAGLGGGLASHTTSSAAAAAGSGLRLVVPERQPVHGIKVTCPVVLVETPSTEVYGQTDWTPLHVDSMDVSVQCQINMAFVRMDLLFTYPAAQVCGWLGAWRGCWLAGWLGRRLAGGVGGSVSDWLGGWACRSACQ